ncbi:hypothetical protein Tco_0887927 [Tanacetum coccineum]
MDIPAISCPSYNANIESANHIFFECDIATDMWKLIFRWCDTPLFQASSWDSLNDWNISWHASKEKKHSIYVITTSVLWWLWRYRNSVTFNSQPLRKSDLFDNPAFKFDGLAYLYANVFSLGVFVGFEDGSSFNPSLGDLFGVSSKSIPE